MYNKYRKLKKEVIKMKEQKTIYAILKISKHPTNYFDCHVYAKQTSNKEKMIEYAKELKQRFPYCKIYLLPREKAKEVVEKHLKGGKVVVEYTVANCE